MPPAFSSILNLCSIMNHHSICSVFFLRPLHSPKLLNAMAREEAHESPPERPEGPEVAGPVADLAAGAERSARSASSGPGAPCQLRRAPAFRNLPVREREREFEMREAPRERMSKESPQSMSATTATSAAPSSYWGLGTPSSRPQRPELRSVPEPTGMDFTWLLGPR